MSAEGTSTMGRDQILLRGDEAARAERVDLVSPPKLFDLDPIGPWAADLDAAYEEARREGFARGRVEGYDQATRQAQGDMRAQTTQLGAALEALLERLEQQAAELGEQQAARTVDLALDIAAAILGREVATAADPGAEAIARCLDVAPREGDLVAHLHPDDAARVELVAGLGDRRLTVVADDRVQPGGAVVRVDETLVDARIASSLERVAEVLR